jgi:hypothetical protein
MSIRKVIRAAFLAVVGAVAAVFAILNLAAGDQQSRYFAAAELSLALIMFGALVHELRVGGWRPVER